LSSNNDIVIAISKKDIASINIGKRLLEILEWEHTGKFEDKKVFKSKKGNLKIIHLDNEHIYTENLENRLFSKSGISPELIIFPSRHSSKKGGSRLCVHPIGNFTEAKFGGSSEEISKSAPYAMKKILNEISSFIEDFDIGYNLTMEATHHGPSDLDIPSMFVELGSTKKEWEDKRAAKILADSIATVSSSNKLEKREINTGISLGGNHYSPQPTEIMLDSDKAIGHIMANHSFNMDMISDAIRETPNCSFIHISKKSILEKLQNWMDEKNIDLSLLLMDDIF